MSAVTPENFSILQSRSAGVLLHPTSLPCQESNWQVDSMAEHKPFGTLGKAAYKFVDFIADSGLTIWQMLPLGPTQADLSPYQSTSAHAGNPNLISLDWLVDRGWAELADIQLSSKDFAGLALARGRCALSFQKFLAQEQGAKVKVEFENFCGEQDYWLRDYVLFSAIRAQYNHASWIQWPKGLRERCPEALAKATAELKADIDIFLFEQFAFFSQWQALRCYAKTKGVYFFGDIPIFVGHDSADVWAEQHYFQLDEQGAPLTVAGVPPDYFSETGQHWGNPHYNWDVMEADGFRWWLGRLRTQLQLFDLIRVDHFRGFDAYWSIPGDAPDARSGSWIKAPGAAFLQACFDAYPDLPLVAENLGVITEEVEALRSQFKLPGMLVLQFAFDGNADNPHLPHNHHQCEVIYTGTHDNDTTLGWYETLSESSRAQLKEYCFNSDTTMPWLLIQAALASVGCVTIIPMQDFLELDGQHRMNLPGTVGNNWLWTFNWEQINHNLAAKIRQHLVNYNRLGINNVKDILPT